MIRYLLDTNIVSYFVKGVSANLVQRMQAGMDAQDIVISTITRAELRYGVSITDSCIGWETTERMLRWGYETLKK